MRSNLRSYAHAAVLKCARFASVLLMTRGLARRGSESGTTSLRASGSGDGRSDDVANYDRCLFAS